MEQFLDEETVLAAMENVPESGEADLIVAEL
jgi:hypothetical protein